MADNDINLYTSYAIGFVKSAKLEIYNLYNQVEIHEPTLIISATVIKKVHSKTTCWSDQPTRRPRNNHLRFKVPVHSLITPTHCKNWIKNSLESAKLKCVASDIKNPKIMFTELIWNLRKKWMAGEKCTGVIDMDVIIATELREKHRKRVLETWGKTKSELFKSTAKESSCCCAICLDVLDDKSMVLELPSQCRHVFHSECIVTWLIRKRRCPLCRSPVRITGDFWVCLEKEKSAVSLDLLLPPLSSFQCCECKQKTE